MTTWTLTRFAYTPKGTFGRLEVPGLAALYTVEQPWRNNRPSRSCIPVGEYALTRYFSPARQEDVILLSNEHLLAQGDANLTPRTFIEIHTANWAHEVKGCIAPGDSLNGSWGVSNSRTTMVSLLTKLTTDVKLVIENAEPGGIPV